MVKKTLMMNNRKRNRSLPHVSARLGQPLQGKLTRGLEGHFLLESVDTDANGSLEGVGNHFVLGRNLAGGVEQVGHRGDHVKHRGIDLHGNNRRAKGWNTLVAVADAAGEMAFVDLEIAVDSMEVKRYIVWIQHPQFNEKDTLHRLDFLDADISYGNLGVLLEAIHRRATVQQQQRT